MIEEKPVDVIPLGFACSSRSLIDRFSVQTERLAFDWAIVKKSTLLRAIDTDGAPFKFDVEDCFLHECHSDKLEVVCANGLVLPHDFKRSVENFPRLDRIWQAQVPDVSKKYQERWRRFVGRCRNPRTSKLFVVSNTQANMHDFCSITNILMMNLESA